LKKKRKKYYIILAFAIIFAKYPIKQSIFIFYTFRAILKRWKQQFST